LREGEGTVRAAYRSRKRTGGGRIYRKTNGNILMINEGEKKAGKGSLTSRRNLDCKEGKGLTRWSLGW